jgi:hypothetical protein
MQKQSSTLTLSCRDNAGRCSIQQHPEHSTSDMLTPTQRRRVWLNNYTMYLWTLEASLREKNRRRPSIHEYLSLKGSKWPV